MNKWPNFKGCWFCFNFTAAERVHASPNTWAHKRYTWLNAANSHQQMSDCIIKRYHNDDHQGVPILTCGRGCQKLGQGRRIRTRGNKSLGGWTPTWTGYGHRHDRHEHGRRLDTCKADSIKSYGACVILPLIAAWWHSLYSDMLLCTCVYNYEVLITNSYILNWSNNAWQRTTTNLYF